MLVLVPTPIGNLGDITLRSLDVLRDVDLILAEDTRTSGKLLKHFSIETSLKSFHAHNEHKSIDKILDLLKSDKKVALISDAGTPGISDPGFLLVRACHENNIPISTLPGATAFVPALVNSGLPCDKFYFEGFLPQKKGRQKRWEVISNIKTTLVLYESPYRIIKLLAEIINHLGSETRVSFSREISKLHEEVVTDTAVKVLETLSEKTSIKGEFVVVVDNRV